MRWQAERRPLYDVFGQAVLFSSHCDKHAIYRRVWQVTTGQFDNLQGVLHSIASFPEVIAEDKNANVSTELECKQFARVAAMVSSLLMTKEMWKDSVPNNLAQRIQLFRDYISARSAVLSAFSTAGGEEGQAASWQELDFWGVKMKERATQTVASHEAWMQHEGGKLHTELVDSLKTAIRSSVSTV